MELILLVGGDSLTFTNIMKANSFRVEKGFTFVESLGALKSQYNSGHERTLNSFNYPDIEINDLESYIITEEAQKREHDNNWITRKERTNHRENFRNSLKPIRSKFWNF